MTAQSSPLHQTVSTAPIATGVVGLSSNVKWYVGPLDPKRMSKWARKAYESWSQQGARNSRGYSSREFVSWWLHEMQQKLRWKCPSVSRIDHTQGYFFGNIRLEEKADNIRERNARCGNPGRKHKAVRAFTWEGQQKVFPSKVAAGSFYGIDTKTIYNHCQRRTKTFFQFGPITSARGVRFEWA